MLVPPIQRLLLKESQSDGRCVLPFSIENLRTLSASHTNSQNKKKLQSFVGCDME
jgi:hypothetical protein